MCAPTVRAAAPLRSYDLSSDDAAKIKGAIEQGLKHNTIPVIIGEPGSGKSMHARWFVAQRSGAVLIVGAGPAGLEAAQALGRRRDAARLQHRQQQLQQVPVQA